MYPMKALEVTLGGLDLYGRRPFDSRETGELSGFNFSRKHNFPETAKLTFLPFLIIIYQLVNHGLGFASNEVWVEMCYLTLANLGLGRMAVSLFD